jgi:protein XagA
MTARGAALAIVLALLGGGAARAGAWPMPAGVTQAILKYENGRASDGFDADGGRVDIPHVADDDLSVFVERGLTDRLTLQGQLGATRGDDGFEENEGRGPISLGLRDTFLVTNGGRQVFSLYLGGTVPGVGRNAAYARPDQGRADGEVRLLYGRSALVFGRETFVDVEAARLFRSELADETRIDLTLGREVRTNWLVLAQAYLGQADTQPVSARWAKVELGLVRRFGSWRVQGGWRETVAGRNVPVEGGPVVALWKTF